MAYRSPFGGSSWSGWLSANRGFGGGPIPRQPPSPGPDSPYLPTPGSDTDGASRSKDQPPQRNPPQGPTGRFANPFSTDWWQRGRNLDYLNSTPDAAYGLWLNLLSGPSGIGNFLKSQQSNLWNSYSGALSQDPTLTWLDYLGKQDIGGLYGKTSPYERGEKPSVYAPRIRYMGF